VIDIGIKRTYFENIFLDPWLIWASAIALRATLEERSCFFEARKVSGSGPTAV
jgi:hypothetical protein